MTKHDGPTQDAFFEQHTRPRLDAAIECVTSTPWWAFWRREPRAALADLVAVAAAVAYHWDRDPTWSARDMNAALPTDH